MKKIHQILALSAVGFLMVFLTGCDKTKPYDLITPPAQVHFVGEKTQIYTLESANSGSFKVRVGTTDVAATDRTVTYKITSPTGAVQGTEYTVSNNGTVTIPAGKTIAEIEIKGDFSFYTSGRKDTLVFTLSEPSVKVAGFMNESIVVMRGPCFDGDVTLSDMAGSYENSTDADEPLYTVKVSGLTETSATTGKGTIANLWNGSAPVEIEFDWTNPSDIQVYIDWQPMGFDYAAGQPMAIRTSPGKKSTFSVCNQTITLYVDFIVENYPAPGSAALYDKEFKISVIR